MKLLQLNYSTKEELQDITVNMTTAEATALVNILGQLNGIAHKKLNIDSDMYDCLTSIFNKENEDGYHDLHMQLKDLNDD